jgi:hypothetical protein
LAGVIEDGTGVVVYPRTLDALIDLVVSLGRSDRERAWAWRQVGLLRDTEVMDPSAAVAAALVSRPELAPAVLVAAAVRGPIPLTPRGWAEVARAVQRVASGADQPSRLVGTADAPEATTVADLVARVLRGPVARQLPDTAVLAPPDRLALARLAGLCAAPDVARNEPVVAAVASALAARQPAGLPAVGENGHISDRHDEASAVDRLVQPAPVSACGGVLFLLRVVVDLDLVEVTGAAGSPLAGRPFGWIASSLGQRLAGAAPDDPAIAVLAGPQDPDDPPSPATTAEAAALATLTDRIEAWLQARMGVDPAENLDWLWRRRVTVVAEPGWIEAVFALDDVDTRVRRVGLDLDPGFVWWLGAVVRFRYA